MGHSPIDLHTHDMLVFFLNLVVGPELAPPVHVDFSLPVLYLEYLRPPPKIMHTSGKGMVSKQECNFKNFQRI